MSSLYWLAEDDLGFPPIHTARPVPNGLLAAGGDLSTRRLIRAYQLGIFPWYEEGQPLLWWSPDPRAVVFTGQFRPSRSLARTLRKNGFEVRLNTAFPEVVEYCSLPRPDSEGTWITPEMKKAYLALHEAGVAQSVECYQDGDLVGGLYGISLGKLFFGESMFHLVPDASKVAFAHLNRLMFRHDCPLIDCQIPNAHLTSLGATTIPRQEFARYLQRYASNSDRPDWPTEPRILPPWTA